MKSQDIRSTFLKFFEEKKHLVVPSAPMVTKDDPTLIFCLQQAINVMTSPFGT